MDELRIEGLERPESATQGLENDTILSTLSHFRAKRQAGEKIGLGLLVSWLKGGGVEEAPRKADEWWRTSQGRERYMDKHLIDSDDPFYFEAAIVELKDRANPERVRAMAFQLEMEQAEHDKLCQGSMGEKP